MMASTLRWTLVIGVMSTSLPTVRGECNAAVVAVASILSTLAVVAIVLVGVYCFMKRRRKAHDIPEGWSNSKNRNKGQLNNGFTDDDEFVIVSEGGGPPRRKGQTNTKETPAILARENKTWSSLPRSDKITRLYREGSCGSLDENIAIHDPEIISVTLESQDIIGLGFNICGNYSDGIRVSEVHNRGPAKEGGDIKVGDRILSVTVSYENIVYEDALTILSYASPYPVKIVLEKATDGSMRDFVDKREKGSSTRRLAHPLYRSRSMDTLKSPDRQKHSLAHPKRAHSEVKIESGKRFLKWRNKNSKKNADLSGKDNAKTSKSSKSGDDKRGLDTNRIVVDTEVYPQIESQIMDRVHFSKQENTYNVDIVDAGKYSGLMDHEIVAENFADEFACQKTPPDKPERKNRRKSDAQNSLPETSGFDEIIVPSTTAFTFSALPPSANDDGGEDVEEEVIVPDSVTRRENPDADNGSEESKEPVKDISGVLEFLQGTEFIDFIPPPRTPSPDMDPVEEEVIVPMDRADRLLLTSAPPTDESSTDDVVVRETMKSPLLDEEALERIIAMNAFAPGTQGWAGVNAGGSQGGMIDDFIPNHPFFTSQPVPRSDSRNDSSDTMSSSSKYGTSNDDVPLNNNRNMAYEIRDDYVTGKPFAVEINKNKNMVRTGSMQLDPHSGHLKSTNILDGNSPVSLRPSSSFDVTTGVGSSEISRIAGADDREALDWSGQRLVRSDSFTNIFIND